MRFQYGFSAIGGLVTEEWLYAWPLGRIQFWFERTTDAESGEAKCKFGSKLAGDKEVWRRATRPNALLLSTAITLNSEQLRPIFDWFNENLQRQWRRRLGRGILRAVVRGRSKGRSGAVPAHRGLRYRRPANGPEGVHAGHAPERHARGPEGPDEGGPVGTELMEIRLSHNTNGDQPVELTLDEESDGTQKIFELAAPWIDTFDNGHVIVIDELHEHLHPSLVRFLVSRFHDPG